MPTLAALEVEFPRLADDPLAGCPRGPYQVLEYLAAEVPEGESLTWERSDVRSHRPGGGNGVLDLAVQRPTGDTAHATVAIGPDGTQTIGYEADCYGLSPEQYILGDYHQVF
jgi:hypothetical protein